MKKISQLLGEGVQALYVTGQVNLVPSFVKWFFEHQVEVIAYAASRHEASRDDGSNLALMYAVLSPRQAIRQRPPASYFLFARTSQLGRAQGPG